jgi:hypothetical protein
MANTKSVVVIFRAMQSQRGRTRLAAVTWFVPAELTIGRPSWTNQQQGSFIALQLCPKKTKAQPYTSAEDFWAPFNSRFGGFTSSR